MYSNKTGTHGWENLGGYLTSSPSAMSFTDSLGYAVVVNGRGGDGGLWHKVYSEMYAGGWYDDGGQLLPGTGSATCAYFDFATGMNHQLYLKWARGDWQSLGGYLTSSPAAVRHAYAKVDVFARGGNGTLWSKWTDDLGRTWSNWYKID
jgi:hypothetical protein